MYQNVNTGEVWKLTCVETDRYFPDGVNKAYKKIYVFENGERWAEDLFFKHWRKVGEAQQSVHTDPPSALLDDGDSKNTAGG